MSNENIWDRIVSETEWVDSVRKLALGANPTVALKALEWVGEGKGYLAGLSGASPEEIIFKGLGDDEQV